MKKYSLHKCNSHFSLKTYLPLSSSIRRKETSVACLGQSCTEKNFEGSGFGIVGKAVAYDTRGPLFESSHWETFNERLFTVNCDEKTIIKTKEAWNG